jgi:hypothetical protein
MYEPVPPTILKRVLERVGYKLFDADNITWIMECGGHIIPVPQTMALVPSDVLDGMLGPSMDADTFNKIAREVIAASGSKPASASPN